jgi:hypothetical protein
MTKPGKRRYTASKPIKCICGTPIRWDRRRNAHGVIVGQWVHRGGHKSHAAEPKGE